MEIKKYKLLLFLSQFSLCFATGGNAEKAGLMPGDRIVSIDKIKVTKKGKEEIENIVK